MKTYKEIFEEHPELPPCFILLSKKHQDDILAGRAKLFYYNNVPIIDYASPLNVEPK